MVTLWPRGDVSAATAGAAGRRRGPFLAAAGARFPLAGVACKAAAVGFSVGRARADPAAASRARLWTCVRSRRSRFLTCARFQSLRDRTRARIEPLGKYPLGMKKGLYVSLTSLGIMLDAMVWSWRWVQGQPETPLLANARNHTCPAHDQATVSGLVWGSPNYYKWGSPQYTCGRAGPSWRRMHKTRPGGARALYACIRHDQVERVLFTHA